MLRKRVWMRDLQAHWVSEIALEVIIGLHNILNVLKQHDYNFMGLWKTEDILKFSTNRFKKNLSF